MSTDTNLRNLKSGEVLKQETIDGSKYTDAVKCSNLSKAMITDCTIIGGSEDCIDINRGGHIDVVCTELTPTGKFAMTIKGGATVTWVDVILNAHGTEVDFDYGNWSDQSQVKGTHNYLCVTTTTGKPAKVRVLNSEKPKIIAGSGPIEWAFPHPDAWYHGICVWFFMFARKNMGMFKCFM